LENIYQVMAKLVAARDATAVPQSSPAQEQRFRSKSAPRRLVSDPAPSALKGKRPSRGGQKKAKVRFWDDSEESDSDVEETVRRLRLFSRDLQGKACVIRPRAPSMEETLGSSVQEEVATDAKAEELQVTDAPSGRGIGRAVAGGAGGMVAGAVAGAMAGVPAAFFTFGLSIPFGATFGSGIGTVAGASYGYKRGTTSSKSSA